MKDEDRVFAKCAWRLIPFMGLLYLASFIDRANVGFAALTMNKDLGFSPSTYGYGAGIFAIGYMLFMVPATIAIERAGVRRGTFGIMALWSIISASNAFVQTPLQFFILRFLLGASEAAFFPAMLFYLTLWFPEARRVRYIATFQAAIPLSYVVGGPISGIILRMDGVTGLQGWQWLFLIEGLPVLLIAAAVLKFLPDRPEAASFLDRTEKDLIIARLSHEDSFKRRERWPALRDWRIVALGLVLVGNTTALYGIQLWLPQIVQSMGFSNVATGLVVAAPFLAAVPLMILWGRSSDARGERIWHVALPLLLTGGALTVASVTQDSGVALVALALAAIGPTMTAPPLNNLPASFLGGAAAAAGLALYNSIGSLGGFIGPWVIGSIREQTGGYAAAMAVIAFCCFMAAMIVLALARVMAPRTVLAES